MTRSVQIEEVITNFTLDGSVDDVSVPNLREQLALLYGVDPSSITISLSSGSVVVSVRIAVNAGTRASEVAAAVQATDDTRLSRVLGVTAVGITRPAIVVRNVTRVEQGFCPRGHWWYVCPPFQMLAP